MLHTIRTNGYHNFTTQDLMRLNERQNFDIMRTNDAPKTNKRIRKPTNRAFEINIVSRLLSVSVCPIYTYTPLGRLPEDNRRSF